MKILNVNYLPSGENSHSKKLLDYFLRKVPDAEYHEIDLIHTAIPHFDYDTMTAYVSRNLLGKDLTPEQDYLMRYFDEIADRVHDCDLLLLSFPMHNFCMPGIVKLFIDAFMFKGKAFDHIDGTHVPLMSNKKVIILYSHGGEYEIGTPQAVNDNVRHCFSALFSFTGIHSFEFISYSTGNVARIPFKLEEALSKIDHVVYNWSLK